MQAATGSVSWVAAQPSVLGLSAPALEKGRGGGGWGGGGGGCRVRAVGVARCCARAQKRPPRVRKTKEERREMVESFVNAYRVSHDGKFPSVNLTHKEVGGSYYIVREIVRDIIQENRVLGPGGLNAMALSFEDCPDSSEVSMNHELGQDSIEILNATDDDQVGKDSALRISNSEESISLQKNDISVQTLLGSSNILEAGVLNSTVQNGSAAGTTLDTSLEKQDDVSCEDSKEIDLSTSEEQATTFAHVSDSDKETDLDSLVDVHEGTGRSITDEVIVSSEPSDYGRNGALSQEHDALCNGSHGGAPGTAVNEASQLAETTGVPQIEQTSLQEHEALPESASTDDVQIMDDHVSSIISTNQMNGFYSSRDSPETEDTTRTTEQSEEHRLQDDFEQPLLHAGSQEQENSESLVSHSALDAKGLLQMENKHNVLQVDESESKETTSGIMKEVEASNARHEHGTSTTTTISRPHYIRRTSKVQQKKEDNLFWLVLRAFVIAVSKLWTK
ncbi:hypothetical protein ACP70R_018715 [Stipagrostis hirtigluma subsp. patula]